MDMSLMLLEQVALSKSHWSVFSLDSLKTLFKSLFNILLNIFLRIYDKKGMYYTLEQKKREKNNILKI